mmetsp:Transcript_2874/g.2952  ORF Transcript_2874/g.2952 Transcript_2874/m.2952 type:complete len:100 (-) Transcript_2874:103-402(-)
MKGMVFFILTIVSISSSVCFLRNTQAGVSIGIIQMHGDVGLGDSCRGNENCIENAICLFDVCACDSKYTAKNGVCSIIRLNRTKDLLNQRAKIEPNISK